MSTEQDHNQTPAPPPEPRTVLPLNEGQAEAATDSVGMIVFLGSWAMMFAALFYTYALLRVRTPFWPPLGLPDLPLVLPGVNTVVLAASSATFFAAQNALSGADVSRYKRLLTATVLLGVVFLALQGWVWTDLWEQGLRYDAGAYGSLFFFLTSFHGLHVLVGLGLLLSLFRSPDGQLERRRQLSRARLVGMFWHFVDLIWLLLFLFVFVL